MLVKYTSDKNRVLHLKNVFSVSSFAKAFITLAILTSSFDIFLNIKIGFNFRFTQIATLAGLFLYFFLQLQKGLVIKKPLGFHLLFTWFLFMLLFVPNGFLVRNVGYTAWLFFNILTIILLVQYIDSREKLMWLFRVYVYSFFVVSLFGIFQFFAPVLGLGHPLISQWWVYGLIPRVSGFSYEPSYFATYLLMGWVTTAYFFYNSRHYQEGKKLIPHLRLVHLTISLAVLLSSSRMGLVMVALWFLQYPAKFAYSFLKLRIKKKLVLVNFVLACGAIGFVALISIIDISIILRLLEGTGLFGTASHSAEGRFPVIGETLYAFAESPFIGYSLGGVAAAIAELRGVTVTDLSQLKIHEGLNIFAEALAASGIIGVIPFILYIITLFYAPLRLASRSNSKFAGLLLSLVLALFFELLILQFNQNILRPYLWMHIAVLSAAYRVIRQHNIVSNQPYAGHE